LEAFKIDTSRRLGYGRLNHARRVRISQCQDSRGCFAQPKVVKCPGPGTTGGRSWLRVQILALWQRPRDGLLRWKQLPRGWRRQQGALSGRWQARTPEGAEGWVAPGSYQKCTIADHRHAKSRPWPTWHVVRRRAECGGSAVRKSGFDKNYGHFCKITVFFPSLVERGGR